MNSMEVSTSHPAFTREKPDEPFPFVLVPLAFIALAILAPNLLRKRATPDVIFFWVFVAVALLLFETQK